MAHFKSHSNKLDFQSTKQAELKRCLNISCEQRPLIIESEVKRLKNKQLECTLLFDPWRFPFISISIYAKHVMYWGSGDRSSAPETFVCKTGRHMSRVPPLFFVFIACPLFCFSWFFEARPGFTKRFFVCLECCLI